MALAEVSAQLEAAGQSDDWAAVAAAEGALAREAARLRDYLEAIRG